MEAGTPMIRRRFLCAGIALMISFILPLHSQSGTPWKDPSPHAVRFVSVGDGFRLEVLDWRGSISTPQMSLHSGTNIQKATTSSSLTMWSVPSPAIMETYECALTAFGPSPIRFLRRQGDAPWFSVRTLEGSAMLDRWIPPGRLKTR
jgi:hypothetical protein